jgi:GNAT superfamily N-acetyltransferase
LSPVTVTTWYLELLRPHDLRPARVPDGALSLVRAEIPLPELNRFLYTAVGRGWYWLDRVVWDEARWLAWLDRPELETWVLYVSGTPAGYFEIESQPGGNVELAYFGLLPRFMGRGLGGYLLTKAIERAFELGAARVWVHTCSLDAPQALANYQARGFRIYAEQTIERELPEVPCAPA